MLGNGVNQIKWMKQKGYSREHSGLKSRRFHWNPKTNLNESDKQSPNPLKILIESFKMSHPDSPGSPTHPEKVIRVFSCVVCTRILILSACRSWRLLFLFLLLTMIFVQGESHYQSSLEREVAAIEQTAGCLPPRVTPIIHQFKSNRRQLDFWGYYPGRCQQTRNCQT